MQHAATNSLKSTKTAIPVVKHSHTVGEYSLGPSVLEVGNLRLHPQLGAKAGQKMIDTRHAKLSPELVALITPELRGNNLYLPEAIKLFQRKLYDVSQCCVSCATSNDTYKLDRIGNDDLRSKTV